MTYSEAARVLDSWSLPELDDAARDALMGGNAARLFGFDEQCV